MKYQFTVPDYKRVRVIVSTDAACEADDPFAIAHALLSPKLDVKAVVAEHFMCEGSMERSFTAAQKLLGLMKSSVPVLHGQVWPKNGELSEGAQCIIDEARRDDPHRLFILLMGATTTMADALRAAPDIADRLTIVTIGGRGYGKHHTDFREFNWGNDPDAINYILRDTRAEVWQIPASGYAHIRVSLATLQRHVAPCGEVGAYLLHQMDEYNQSEGAGWTAGESWSLGDNPSVAVVIDDCAGRSQWENAWLIDADTFYTQELPDRRIRVFHTMNSHFILGDLFDKLALNFG
ncbi:MAG: nucleoside hydrolase [Clostridia bacterium]|nr:nucleoside hydrolase [Clostridia bacterium]